MKFYCDNESAIDIAYNSIQHDKTKHIEIDRHFIKKKLEVLGCMSYILSKQQVVDVPTKGLNTSNFHDLTTKLEQSIFNSHLDRAY